MVFSLTACVEGIIRLITIFHLHRIFSIFLRNDCNGKVGKGVIIFENVSRFQGNNMIIQDFLLAKKILDIFEKRSQLKGWKRSRYFLRKYRKSDTVVIKEYYDYSSFSTLTENSHYF